MKHRRFNRPKDGEWVQPKMKGYLMGCCDCGLVHRMNFRVAKSIVRGNVVVDHVQFQAERAEGYTKKFRKKKQKVIV